MRTKLEGMGDGEPADQADEPGRDQWDAATRRVEFFETDDAELVLFDGKNPLTWIKSTYFGVPIDILEPITREAEADGAGAGADDDE